MMLLFSLQFIKLDEACMRFSPFVSGCSRTLSGVRMALLGEVVLEADYLQGRQVTGCVD